MIEIYSVDRTNSYGRFANFKAAKSTLHSLIASGKLSGEKPSILVCSYKNNEPQREYVATCFGTWKVPKVRKTLTSPESKKKTRRKRGWCKRYPSPEAYFKEGFPDWLNKVYQPVR